MRFFIDAQLPLRLKKQLVSLGFEAIHTLELPLGNRTPDAIINEMSLKDHYIVVTKDSDFVDSFYLQRKPWKLLLVSTGNIKNTDLEALFLAAIATIVQGFSTFDFIEINEKNVIFHS